MEAKTIKWSINASLDILLNSSLARALQDSQELHKNDYLFYFVLISSSNVYAIT